MPSITGNIADATDETFPPGRLLVTLESSDAVADGTVTGGIRFLPPHTVTVDSNGDVSATDIPATVGTAPLYRLTLEGRAGNGQSRKVTLGWFELTSDRTLAWIKDNTFTPAVLSPQALSDIEAAAALGATNDTATASFINDSGSATTAALDAALAVPLDDPDDARGDAMLVHDAGTKLVTIRGAIRNDGDGSDNNNFWRPIIDADHQCDVGVASITTGTANVNINFTRNLGKRVSCAVTADETMVANGFRVGASFSSGMLQLTFARHRVLSDELTWNGSAWVWAQGGRFTVDSDSSGVLTIGHAPLKGRAIMLFARTGASASYTPVVTADGGATSLSTSFKFGFRNSAGTLITSRAAGDANNLRCLVVRQWEGSVNPQTDLTTADYPLHNVWFEATAHLLNDDAS